MSNYTPNIIKETAGGLTCYTIKDEMFKNREVECIGEINSESVNSIISQLMYLNAQDNTATITLYINSPGGEVSSGLALYDIMQAIACPIRTVCVGTAASMGALVFAAGDQRDILTHGRVMIHDPLISGGLSGSALRIRSVSEDLMRTREITAQILAKHTQKPIEEILEVTANDTFFYAKEAIEFGLADKIITKIN